jgi:hypothetical protein
MTRDRIGIASTAKLEARLDEIEGFCSVDIEPANTLSLIETFPGEAHAIDRELDARYYANHDDARVRQGMGEE